MRKGCMVYLAYVIDSKKDTDQLSNLLVVRQFLEVIPDKLSWLPLKREIKVSIGMLPSTTSISYSLYRMAFKLLIKKM